jgi:hypothetical protein
VKKKRRREEEKKRRRVAEKHTRATGKFEIVESLFSVICLGNDCTPALI